MNAHRSGSRPGGSTSTKSGGQQYKIPAENRLLRYGIGRDTYEAHMMSRLGLVTVTPDRSRGLDGKVEGYNHDPQAFLHVFSFHPDKFNRDALTELTTQTDYQLGR
jgi:hypothetical protein